MELLRGIEGHVVHPASVAVSLEHWRAEEAPRELDHPFPRKIPSADGYRIDHTVSAFLLDRDGEYVGALKIADGRGRTPGEIAPAVASTKIFAAVWSGSATLQN